MKRAQTHLSRLIKQDGDFMAKCWSDVIPLAQTDAAFVDVQDLQDFKSENGIPVRTYRQVFQEDEKTIHKRIVIQADPGCGKTTYVDKLALAWANEDEYLRDKFDFVFLIALQTLTMNINDTIKCFLPRKLEQWFESYARNCESKILLILDGFDELVENSVGYSSVMDVLNGKSMQFQFFNLIVTTPRSHVDKIPEQFHRRCLLIKESMKQFPIKQHVPFSSVGQESNLSDLLQTPLYCAIYCSLHFGGGDPIELEDSYDLIKALVENSVNNTVKKKTENEKEQLDEIGKFAFQMLDSSTLKFVKKFCTSSKIKPSFDLRRVNLDLLIKRTIPLGGVNRFKEEFSFPNQSIAEYLAARYFARSLTKEQLKQADASKLIPDFSDGSVLNLPFVRFFLFELLFLYLEQKYDESVFDNFLNIPQLRFIWNIKSNTDIRTLDNVIDFDLKELNHEFRDHSRFIPTLSKYRNLSSLNLSGLSKNQVEQLVSFINNNCFHNLIKLNLSENENVGSTPQLFTALSKCKHLQVLHLKECQMTVESTTELARCIDNNGLADLRELQLYANGNVGSTPQLFTALSKCKHLQVLDLQWCRMTIESTTELARCIYYNGLADLIELDLERNENVGSTPQLFTALSKCKHLQVLHLKRCQMTVESTTELARCIDNNRLTDLTQLDLSYSENVGSSTYLFRVLHKCPQLQRLDLGDCSMTQESFNIFLSTFESNTFQQLGKIWLWWNEKIKVDDNFFIALEKCPKISTVHLSKYMESDLSEVGRKAKETLEQRGCQFLFY